MAYYKTMFCVLLEFASSPPPRGNKPGANFNTPSQLYNLWMRINDPRNHMVTTLGPCLKGPLVP